MAQMYSVECCFCGYVNNVTDPSRGYKFKCLSCRSKISVGQCLDQAKRRKKARHVTGEKPRRRD